MSTFIRPLLVFLGGNIALLFVILFFPAIGTATTQLAADTAGWTGWGWSWVVSSAKLFVFVIMELLILYGTARAFLSSRNS